MAEGEKTGTQADIKQATFEDLLDSFKGKFSVDPIQNHNIILGGMVQCLWVWTL